MTRIRPSLMRKSEGDAEATPSKPPLTRGQRSFVRLMFCITAMLIFLMLRPRSPLDTAVFVTRSDRGGAGLQYQCLLKTGVLVGFDNYGEKEWNAYAFDIATGRRQRLDALKQSVRGVAARGPYGRPLVSPDGKWLLWGSTTPTTGPRGFVVAALDGSKVYTWKNHRQIPAYNLIWRGDSRAWMLLERHGGRLPHVARLHVYPLRSPTSSVVQDVSHLKLEPYIGDRLADGRILMADADSVHFSLFDPQHLERPVSRLEFPLTDPNERRQVMVAPKGDRLAWCTTRSPKTSIELAQIYLHGGSAVAFLYVTDLNGKKRVDLGQFEPLLISHGGDDYGIFGWMPDGSALIFEQGRDGEDNLKKVRIPD